VEIICTIIPDARGVERFPLVYDAGMTMVRMNFAHIDHDGARRLAKATRTFNKLRGGAVRVMQDLMGARMLMGHVPGGEVEVPVGQPVRFVRPGLEERSVRYRGIVVPVRSDMDFARLADARKIAAKNATILFEILDNRASTEGWIETEVRRPGVMHDDMGLNAPGIKRDGRLTQRDLADLSLGLRLKVDVVCLSFVTCADEIRQARSVVGGRGRGHPEVWAKMECAEALENAVQIVKAADAIVIGRGDLAAETDRYEVAGHQGRLARLARKHGRRCFVATGILESMRWSVSPTFAELHDIHASLKEGVDGFVLTSETSIGRFPHLAVEVIRDAAAALGV
jgi:pyruvate kinase